VGVGLGRDNWAWKERTMCQDINVGYYFGLERSGGGWDEAQKLGMEGKDDVSGHQSWILIWS
jgi:hypothetical protein